MLYIWKVERTDDWGYDEYSDAIVVAKTEADAIAIGPDEFHDWYSTEPLKVTKVGKPVRGIPAGTILCASYHAG